MLLQASFINHDRYIPWLLDVEPLDPSSVFPSRSRNPLRPGSPKRFPRGVPSLSSTAERSCGFGLFLVYWTKKTQRKIQKKYANPIKECSPSCPQATTTITTTTTTTTTRTATMTWCVHPKLQSTGMRIFITFICRYGLNLARKNSQISQSTPKPSVIPTQQAASAVTRGTNTAAQSAVRRIPWWAGNNKCREVVREMKEGACIL